jgi:quinolinate synthase
MEDKQKLVLELLSTKTISEQHRNLRMRAARIKQILKEYKEKYPVIVIVAHYYTIEFIKSTGFK